MNRIIGVLAFCLTLVLFGMLAFNYYLGHPIGITESQVIEVPRGANLHSLAKNFARLGIIDNPTVFVKVAQILEYDRKLKYGEYLFEPNDTYQNILDKVTSGKTYRYKVTFIEGEHLYDYAKQVEAKGLGKAKDFLRWTKDPSFIKNLLGESLPSLEGYLFPDTYSFSKSDGVKVIIATMVKRFVKQTQNLSMKAFGLNRHQILSLASIIEKETGAGFERPLISSVFHNRLKKKMRLQTDPTIIYGILHETGKEIHNIRKKDIRRPTAYNTYVIKGLPPGPIGNPGLASIRAALKPEPSQYLYFVSQNDGTHIFSTNYKDHLAAVKKFQLNPARRKGRSWRDLKKRKSETL